MSTDGGKTVNTAAASKIHSDHHAIWINPANSNHVLIGNDGGLAQSAGTRRRPGTSCRTCRSGSSTTSSVDMATPYNICGGMQDNYSWCGPSAVRGTAGIAGFTLADDAGRRRVRRRCRIRPTSASPTANRRTATWSASIASPARRCRSGRRRTPGEPPLRWNWDTPLVMSPHDPKIIFAAGNKVFRSSNRGLNWETVGTDLTSNANREEIVDDGREGQRHPDREERRHPGVAAPSSRSPSRRSAPASSTRGPTTASCR